MNLGLSSQNFNFFGLFELEKNGKILYMHFKNNKQFISLKPRPVELNFFENIAGFDNKAEFKSLFDNFYESNQNSDDCTFDCRFNNEIVPIRVMMLKAYGASCLKPPDIVILNIREYLH